MSSQEPLVAHRDAETQQRILAGDEAAFVALVKALHPLLLRLAGSIVRSSAIAEEVVQDTWLAVLQGLPAFAGRSSLKTWVVRILYNRARTRAVREARSLPFSSLTVDESAAALEDFASHGGWLAPPLAWHEHATPERALADAQTRALVEDAIAKLPEAQRIVIELRDIAQLESAEVCQMLDLSEANQRVLLHRARHRVRAALADR